MLQFSSGLYQEIVLKYLKRKGTCSKIKIHVNSATERYHLKKVPRDPPNQGNTTCSHNAMKDKHEYWKLKCWQFLTATKDQWKTFVFSKLCQDHISLLTIKLVTDVNIIDQRRIFLYDHLGNIIMYTGGIQETQVKNVLSHSSTLVDIPVNMSCSTAYSACRAENKRNC